METTITASALEPLGLASMERLLTFASKAGDISDLLTDAELTEIGSAAVQDYEQDCRDREDWERIAKEALKKASQEEKKDVKTFPWHEASNVDYPLLTIAGLQFNARAYPAIVKGDEAVSVKVIGKDTGRPVLTEDGQVLPQMTQDEQGQPVPVMGPQGPMPTWEVEPGTKTKRAQRVRDYMNTTIFYRMDDWESDTDMLLMQLPIVGCAFRKVWFNGKKHCASLVHALNLVAPMATKSCKTAIRLTEKLPEQYPADILEQVLAGYYRNADFLSGEEFDQTPRLLLEQHRLIDLDKDGYPEPYIVTVDHSSGEVLRIVANFEAKDIQDDGEKVTKIERRSFYVKYSFFPHPEGKFYDIGLGHLLNVMSGVIDTVINQMIDAGTAQVAGGGWVGSGVRLTGSKRSSSIFPRPGEYKTVDVPGNALREGIVERTYPNVSPVMFQLLEMMLGAAKDISSIKDVITGEASNNGQVGTTLALIEQGLQVFTAIYKRVYRSLKEEFTMLRDNMVRHADAQTQADYVNILDDPLADFAKDFMQDDMDIRPVSDPSSVTKMQAVARANFLMAFVSAPGVDAQAIMRRAFEAADVDDIDELFIPPQPPQPNPKDIAGAEKDMATVANLNAKTEAQKLENLANAFNQGAMSIAA